MSFKNKGFASLKIIPTLSIKIGQKNLAEIMTSISLLPIPLGVEKKKLRKS